MKDADIQKMQSAGELMLNDNSENEDINEEVDSLIAAYPYLKLYPDYIVFLRDFSGLTFLDDETDGSISFYGFDDEVTLDLVGDEGDIINTKGFFVIGDYTYRNSEKGKIEHVGFGFDATNTREKGIYSFNDSGEKPVTSSFDELVSIFLNDRDKLLFA